MSLFDKILDRSKNSYKVSKMMQDKQYLPDSNTVAYTVADMDFPIMPEIVEAITNYMQNNTFGYTYPMSSYYNAVSNYVFKHHNLKVTKENIFPYTSVLNSIEDVIQVFSHEEDGVVIFTPVYPPFYRIIRNNQRKIIECPLILDGGYYSIDFLYLEELLKKHKPKILLFCSPHNPVGRVWKKEELEEIVELCKKHNCLIISDEIHMDFVMNGHKHIPLATLAPENTFICTSPSKTFNVSGLNVSNLIILNKKLAGYLSDSIGKKTSHNVNALGLVGCEAAYTYGDEWVRQVNELIDSNYHLIKNRLAKYSDVIITPLQGTYLMWIDLRLLGLDNLIVKLKEVQLFVADGRDYGDSCEGFIRVNIAYPKDMIETFCDRFDRFMFHVKQSSIKETK